MIKPFKLLLIFSSFIIHHSLLLTPLVAEGKVIAADRRHVEF